MDFIRAILSSFTTYYYYIVALLLFLVFLEQISYIKKKGPIPGPTLVFPFIGNAISLVSGPAQFWEVQSNLAKTSSHGISANYVIGKYMVFIRSTDLSRKVFLNVHPNAFQFMGHPFGKKLFGEHNIIYMFGQEHKDLRRRIAPNFTRKALSTYTSSQQKIILKHLIKWQNLSNGEPINLRLLCRDMNLETSQSVFVGPYLDKDSEERFKIDYNLFNLGMLTLPIDLPWSTFRKAKLALKRLHEILIFCTNESEKKMKSGHEPTCLVDYYVREILKDTQLAKINTTEIGSHLFDFLFAAQDASTSSLLWAITYLESNPKILEKVRQEAEVIEQIQEMKYTQAVAKEVLRIKAPAAVIPHVAVKDFILTDTYTIPKGTVVFPSVYESSFQGFVDPEKFDPDRFLEERQEDRIYEKNFLVFGTGAHRCVGQNYAVNHLVLFIAMFSLYYDFKRHRTNGCDNLVFVLTISPKDDCRVYLSPRKVTQFPIFS